jgi:two-component sensor histidine kinase
MAFQSVSKHDFKGVTQPKMSVEEELKHNLIQQELLAEIALGLNNYQNFSESIQKVLEALMQHTQVSRIYIFENVDNGLACSNTFEVCNEGVEPQINNLAYVPYEAVPLWQETLNSVGYIFSQNIADLPDKVREILEPQGIKSILVLPLVIKGEFSGFIGFDECAVHKNWKRSELELLRAISGIISNTYEREYAYKSILAKNEELNKINSELDRFVYSVSHDLRAPLSSLLGLIKICNDLVPNNDAGVKNILEMMQLSVNKLDVFIGAILDYSRNSRKEILPSYIDFNKIIQDVRESLNHVKTEHEYVMQIDIKEDSPFYSDEHRIAVILNNLISNAMKYLDAKKKECFIRISVLADVEKCQLTIEDNGIGIDRPSQQKVFEMFYRAAETSTGSGLGLYIVKETIQKLNGSIKLDSELSKGTKIQIELPNLRTSDII